MEALSQELQSVTEAVQGVTELKMTQTIVTAFWAGKMKYLENHVVQLHLQEHL